MTFHISNATTLVEVNIIFHLGNRNSLLTVLLTCHSRPFSTQQPQQYAKDKQITISIQVPPISLRIKPTAISFPFPLWWCYYLTSFLFPSHKTTHHKKEVIFSLCPIILLFFPKNSLYSGLHLHHPCEPGLYQGQQWPPGYQIQRPILSTSLWHS